MVTIYTPFILAASENAIEERIAEKENPEQNSTLSEAFLNMRRKLRNELQEVVHAEWTDSDVDNIKTIEVKD